MNNFIMVRSVAPEMKGAKRGVNQWYWWTWLGG